jgi:hypothetical protein
VRFYGIDPLRVLQLPTYLVDILLRQMPRLDNEEAALAKVDLIEAASFPHMERSGQRRVLRAIDRSLRAGRPRRPPVEVVEHDPQKAAEWFRAIGAKVE